MSRKEGADTIVLETHDSDPDCERFLFPRDSLKDGSVSWVPRSMVSALAPSNGFCRVN